MKKIIFFLFGLLFTTAYAADIASVNYIHKLLETNYGIYVPTNETLDDPDIAANMEYLLTVIDVANAYTTGTPTSYGTTIYATQDAADTVVTQQAFNTLLKDTTITNYEFPFELNTAAINSFQFTLSAQGEFVIDWGDDTTEIISKTDTTNTTHSHTYSTATNRTIKFGGTAVDYNDTPTTATISFQNNADISAIYGNLSAIFPTLESGKNPRFYNTFAGLTGINSTIPANLFINLTGAPIENMFYGTFNGTSGLRGAIPENIFGNLSGSAAQAMFYETFKNCSQLTGSIPATLFSGITGVPARDMFYGTFYGCTKLRGNIPTGLFSAISGPAAPGMFSNTFNSCTKLSGIDTDIFGSLTGDAQTDMFTKTFYGNNKLYGYSAQINGQYLYEIWPNATTAQVGGMYFKCQKLSDYKSIPGTWR